MDEVSERLVAALRNVEEVVDVEVFVRRWIELITQQLDNILVFGLIAALNGMVLINQVGSTVEEAAGDLVLIAVHFLELEQESDAFDILGLPLGYIRCVDIELVYDYFIH